MLVDLPIGEIIVGDRIRKDAGFLGGLQASIFQVGLLHPLVLNSRKELIAGFRRLQAVKNLEWETVPCLILDRLDDVLTALRAELYENTDRENMTPSEIIAAGKLIEGLEKGQARERQAQAGPETGRGKKTTASGNFPEAVGRARDKVGAVFGISGRTYEKAKQVVAAAEQDPVGFGDLIELMDTQSVDAAYREMRTRQAEDVEEAPEVASPAVSLEQLRQIEAAEGEPDEDDEEYVCECGQIFSVEVWHCQGCSHHWLPHEQTCRNCYQGRDGKDWEGNDESERGGKNDEGDHDTEDEPDEEEEEAGAAASPACSQEAESLPVQAEKKDAEELTAEDREEIDRLEADYRREQEEARRRAEREARASVRNLTRMEQLEHWASQAEPSDQWEIRLGDCAYGMPSDLHGKARLIFADPPYNIGWDYGDGVQADLLSGRAFLSWCRTWLEQVPNLLTPDGSFWLLISDEYAAEVKLAAEDTGLWLRQWLIWCESFGVNCQTKFNRCHRHLLHFVMDESDFVFHAETSEVRRPSDRQAKYGDSRAAEGGKLWDSVWGLNPPIPRVCGTHEESLPGSPAPQLPLALLRPILAVATDPGDLVIDPFTGNATTGVAALQLGRRFLGWEIREPIHRLATLRMKATQAKLKGEQP